MKKLFKQPLKASTWWGVVIFIDLFIWLVIYELIF